MKTNIDTLDSIIAGFRNLGLAVSILGSAICFVAGFFHSHCFAIAAAFAFCAWAIAQGKKEDER